MNDTLGNMGVDAVRRSGTCTAHTELQATIEVVRFGNNPRVCLPDLRSLYDDGESRSNSSSDLDTASTIYFPADDLAARSEYC